ncbi:MAG: hypothetical protein P8102_10465 [Gammaproteobacteria bacterium]
MPPVASAGQPGAGPARALELQRALHEAGDQAPRHGSIELQQDLQAFQKMSERRMETGQIE